MLIFIDYQLQKKFMMRPKFKFTVIFHFLFSKLWWNNFKCIWNNYLYKYFNWIQCKYLWRKYSWCKYFWNIGLELFALISWCGKHSQVSLFGILVLRSGPQALLWKILSESDGFILCFCIFSSQFFLKTMCFKTNVHCVWQMST